MNHYEALGVPMGASAKELRHAYLAAARRHHPDFHATDEARARADHARQMQHVNEAWTVLGDAAAREHYDLTLRVGANPARERDRPNRDPEAPEGKGWTPRADDDGWQQDFRGWAADDDRLADDEPGAGPDAVKLLPLGLFGLGMLIAFVGMALDERGLMAVALVTIAVSAILFVMLPAREMIRSRGRGRS